MGLTRWVSSKLLFSILVLAGFYVLGQAMGIIPKPLENIVSWLSNNFLLISVLIMFLFTWLIIKALTSKRRISK